MFIEGSNHKYRITHVELAEDDKEMYKCVEEIENTKKYYLIIRIKRFNDELIKYLTKPGQNESFADCEEYFIKDDELYVVFIQAEGESLKKRLQNESLCLRERLQIGAFMFGRLILKVVPYYFAYDGLMDDHVRITRSLEVNFKYSLYNVENACSYGMKEVNEAALRWIEQLFKDEIRNKVSRNLQNLCEELSKGKYEDYNKIYYAYLGACTELLMLHDKEGALEPKKTLYIIWDKVKNFIMKWEAVFAIILIAAVITLSVTYYVHHQKKIFETEELMDAIGIKELGKSR